LQHGSYDTVHEFVYQAVVGGLTGCSVPEGEIVVVDGVEHVFDFFYAVAVQGYNACKEKGRKDEEEREVRAVAFYPVMDAEADGCD
jgi:hypothetical protein